MYILPINITCSSMCHVLPAASLDGHPDHPLVGREVHGRSVPQQLQLSVTGIDVYNHNLIMIDTKRL